MLVFLAKDHITGLLLLELYLSKINCSEPLKYFNLGKSSSIMGLFLNALSSIHSRLGNVSY